MFFWFIICGCLISIPIITIIHNIPSEEKKCAIIDQKLISYPCVMDGGYICQTATPQNFKIDLFVECDDTSNTIVYSLERTYCQCCDANYAKYCIFHWEPLSWNPFAIQKYNIISDKPLDLPINSSHIFYKSNGILYLTAHKDVGFIVTIACILFVLVILISMIFAVLLFPKTLFQRIPTEEPIEVREESL